MFAPSPGSGPPARTRGSLAWRCGAAKTSSRGAVVRRQARRAGEAALAGAAGLWEATSFDVEVGEEGVVVLGLLQVALAQLLQLLAQPVDLPLLGVQLLQVLL